MRRLLLAPVFSLTLLIAASVVRADVLIDSFQDRPLGLPLIGGFESWQGLVTQSFPNVVGGRGMSLGGTTPTLGYLGEVSADVHSVGGVSSLEYTSLNANGAGDLLLAYGGDAPSIMGAQPLGLAVNPTSDALRLTFSGYEGAGGEDLIINVYFQTQLYQFQFGDISAAPDWTARLTAAGSQSVDIPLNGLADPTLDFVTFAFLAPEGTNFQLGSVAFVTGVPEPGAIWLLAPVLTLCRSRKARRIQGR